KTKPIFRITPLAAPEVSATLDESGWQTTDHSHVYARELGEHAADAEAHYLAINDPKFVATQGQLQGYDEATITGFTNLIAVLKAPAIGVVIARDGQAVASGLMAIADGIVITGNVITDPTHRRQGLAKS